MSVTNKISAPLSNEEIKIVVSALSNSEFSSMVCNKSTDIMLYILSVGESEIDDNWSVEEMELSNDYSGAYFRTHVYPLIGVFRTLIEEEKCWVSLMLRVGIADFQILIEKLRSMFCFTYRKSVMIYLERLNNKIQSMQNYINENDMILLKY
ncbi:hypothetical protein FV219_00670 [Methylobacterium sp. WL122]|nr:hypothetical protein FV219_00670 [Methylobacterium sp. WL122]